MKGGGGGGRTEALAKDLRVYLAFHADSKADIDYARDRLA